jgi:hypothetical protein
VIKQKTTTTKKQKQTKQKKNQKMKQTKNPTKSMWRYEQTNKKQTNEQKLQVQDQ